MCGSRGRSPSAMLYPFHINVTTDPAVHAAAGRANSGCVTMIYADIGAGSSCGLNIIGTGRCCSNHLYRGGYATGRIISHESGHGLGMGHDGGDNGGEYFNGFSEFQWTALMGNVWPGDRWAEGLFQWSKGEYTSATRNRTTSPSSVERCRTSTTTSRRSKPLTIEGTMVRREANWGQIARNTDTDSWTFRVAAGGGRAMLKINRIEDRGGGMLDVDASIVDATEKVMAQNNTMVARSSTLNVDLPAGDYTLIVKGGGEGTPARGFSNYSSVGLYAIEGTITGGMGTPSGTGGTGGAAGTGGTTGAGGAGGGAGRWRVGRGGSRRHDRDGGNDWRRGNRGGRASQARRERPAPREPWDGGNDRRRGNDGHGGTRRHDGNGGHDRGRRDDRRGRHDRNRRRRRRRGQHGGSRGARRSRRRQWDAARRGDRVRSTAAVRATSRPRGRPSASLLAAMAFGTVWFRRRGRGPLFAATSPSAGRGAGSRRRLFHRCPTGGPRSHRRPTAPRRPPWARRSCIRRRRPET